MNAAPTRVAGDRRRLLAVAVALPVVEAVLVRSIGVPSGTALAPQVTAVGPFGVFHDLRWLMVFHDSIPAFVLGLLLLLGFRSALAAWITGAAWPAGRVRPSGRRLFLTWLAADAVVLVFLSPWVTLLFGAAVVPFSWVFLAAVPPALATILLANHSGIDGGWWRRPPPLRSMAWVLATFLVMSLAALAVAGRPLSVVAPVAAAAGWFNARAWVGTVEAVVERPARVSRLVPATALALAGVFLMVVGGAGVGFAALADVELDPSVGDRGGDGGIPVLVVGGFANACCSVADELAESGPSLWVRQFSYVGTGSRGEPIPHHGSATDGDLEQLAILLDQQIDAMYRESRRPVYVIAESEGTLVVDVVLDRGPSSRLAGVMLLSPIVDPVRVSFPDPGEEGRGMVAGYELRVIGEMIEGMAPFPVAVDGPLAQSLRERSASDSPETCADSIDIVAVIPLADSVSGRVSDDYDWEVVVLPAFHGGLLGRSDVQEMAVAWANGAEIDGSPLLETLDRVIAGSAAAWHVPSLDAFAEASRDGCSSG